MASSNKSEKLGLSLWESTDRPERLDFYRDNEILERELGGHLANALLHMTPDEKAKLQKPYWINVSTGTTVSSRYLDLDFQPRLILMICMDNPPVVPRSDGLLDVYWDYCYIEDDNKTYHSLGGLAYTPSTKRLTSYSRVSPYNSNLVMRMNEEGKKYLMLCLPA